MKKNIIIIATGGTIAGSGDAGKAADYQAGRIDVSAIVSSVPAIADIAELTTIQLYNIDSNDMEEAKWLRLRDLINYYGKDPSVDGIVVTHGTDTLEETAFFLNLTISHDKPVVLTGSMRPATAAQCGRTDESLPGRCTGLQQGSRSCRCSCRFFGHDLFGQGYPKNQQLQDRCF